MVTGGFEKAQVIYIRSTMDTLCFATSNRDKLEEIRALLEGSYRIISPGELGFHDEIEETGTTFSENAELKARTTRERLQVDCFADDSGLEVDALNGAPGVYSARYAGEGCRYEDNVNKLLREMTGKRNRNARFKTSICLILQGETFFFEGSIEGVITEAPRGSGGFGYDPVFQPEGFDQTFAELSAGQKNAISHRAKAIRQLADFLQSA